MSIYDLKNGDSFKVRSVILPREIGKRLADMGFTAGIEGTVVRCALFGDPLQVKIMGYDVSIRVAEAKGVLVELLKQDKEMK
jgi:ferrous iron transport protein A